MWRKGCPQHREGVAERFAALGVRWAMGMAAVFLLAPAPVSAADAAEADEDSSLSPEELLIELPEPDDLDLPPPEAFLVDLPEEPRRPAAPDEEDVARLRAGFADIQEGNFELAERLFREVLERAPDEPMARLGLSTALLSLHAYEEAESLLHALAEEYPEDHAVLNNLAWLYATARETRFRDGERAVRYARKALLQNPSSHHVWSTLAEAHFVRGAYAQAVRAAEQALHFARAAEADESTLDERRRLLDRARKASRAFEILD